MENIDRAQQWILTEAGLLELTTGILEVVNQRIEGSIVQEISDATDDKHVPSVKAVYEYINAFPHMKTQFVRGDINDIPVEERSDKIIYVQAATDSEYWAIYFWNAENEEWVWVNIDLSNYWTKDDEDVATLKDRLGVNAAEARLDTAEGKIENLETGVDNIGSITDEDLQSIIAQAIEDTLADLYDDPVEPGDEEQDPDNSDPENPDVPVDPENPDNIMG